MWRHVRSRVSSFFNKPLFGMIVVSKDAAVDPALFPEDAYPIYCSKCHYNLRGLPDGRCPECGTDFTRGQLLVRTYVRHWSGALWRESNAYKWFWRLHHTAFLMLAVCWIIGIVFYWEASKATTNSPSPMSLGQLSTLVLIAIVAVSVGGLSLVTAYSIAMAKYPRGSYKRRRAIIDAIKQARAKSEEDACP